jgi:chromate transporter
VAIAVIAFVAMFFFDVPFPLVIGLAAVAGLLVSRGARPLDLAEAPDEAASPPTGRRDRLRRSLIALGIGLVLWITPTALLAVLLGPSSLFVQLALFFSLTAVVTFGGAYAVLAFVAQQAVDVYGWLAPGQMLDGLGLAETTPGPLIMVVQFVGFMAVFAQPSGLDPFVAGALAGLLVTWVTFVPSFVFIFVGAPHVEALRHVTWLSAALTGVTAAVCGVIANLAAWFALQTLFAATGEYRLGPLRLHTVELGSVDLFAVGLAVLAFIALVRLRWSLLLTLAICAVLGGAWFLVR